MNKAAKVLLGTHDFASFCKVHTDVKTTICTITQAEWSNFQHPDGPTSNSAAVFTITADRFLRNMVRAVVGTRPGIKRNGVRGDGVRTGVVQHAVSHGDVGLDCGERQASGRDA